MSANHEIPKGPEDKVDKNIAPRQPDISGARDEAFKAMEQGHFAQTKTEAFKESPVNVVNKAVQAFTGADFKTGNQQDLNEVINKTMPKAFEALKALTGASMVDAGVKLTKLYAGAIDSTKQRIDNVTQQHADVVASLPAAERQAYEAKLKELSRGK